MGPGFRRDDDVLFSATRHFPSTATFPRRSTIAPARKKNPGTLMTTYFSEKTFKFLRALGRHNNREWFHEHKADYEAHLRGPFQQLIGDLQPDLLAISEHYRADPKGVGGSLFRIHRDTRFSNDKTPYKTWAGARIFHARRKEVDAP